MKCCCKQPPKQPSPAHAVRVGEGRGSPVETSAAGRSADRVAGVQWTPREAKQRPRRSREWHAPTRFAVRRQHPMRVTGEVGTCGLMIGDGWMRITLCFSAAFPCAAGCFPGNRRFSRHTRTKTRKSIIRKNEEKRGNRRKSKHSICILKKFQKWVDIRFAL